MIILAWRATRTAAAQAHKEEGHQQTPTRRKATRRPHPEGKALKPLPRVVPRLDFQYFVVRRLARLALARVTLEDERGIVATEAEVIGDRHVERRGEGVRHVGYLGGVGGEGRRVAGAWGGRGVG